jgi:uncharacterized alkaline shock family protein YloU
MGSVKPPAIQPQSGKRSLGRIEVLPNAIHSIAAQAVYESYGVVGIAAPHLQRNGRAILLSQQQSNQGIRVRIANDRIIIDVYLVLEYGLRMSEIAHNIMSSIKFSVEKMLGIPVQQVNVNIQGLAHGPATQGLQSEDAGKNKQ